MSVFAGIFAQPEAVLLGLIAASLVLPRIEQPVSESLETAPRSEQDSPFAVVTARIRTRRSRHSCAGKLINWDVMLSTQSEYAGQTSTGLCDLQRSQESMQHSPAFDMLAKTDAGRAVQVCRMNRRRPLAGAVGLLHCALTRRRRTCEGNRLEDY